MAPRYVGVTGLVLSQKQTQPLPSMYIVTWEPGGSDLLAAGIQADIQPLTRQTAEPHVVHSIYL
jgi:hypothetical protein